MADLTIPKGDKGYYLNFTVKNSDATAFDLTGYTIALKVWPPTKPTELIMSGTVSIVTAASGTCRYSIVAGDFASVGLYNAELELTASGVIESCIKFTLEVTESPS